MTGTETKPRKPGRNPWPIVIICYFIVFITGMVTWIVYASHQRMDLVRSDYYEKEILFQQQIDASRRAREAVDVKVGYNLSQQTISIQLPAAHKLANATGTIHFYRPSNAGLDHDVALSLTADGSQRIDARDLAPGLWKVRLSWHVGAEEFYFDQPLVLGGKS
jgi:nitrogen fixation protein FixH